MVAFLPTALLPMSKALGQSTQYKRCSGCSGVGVKRDVGEIVVTATRRAEVTHDIPATITALGSEQLAAHGTTTLDQVAEQTPGFTITKLGDTRPRLFIRGIGTREYDPGAEASVGLFIDDMYVGRQSGVLSSLRDIARIEVLKGPQTTLYGRNTLGGAINVVSRAPTKDPHAEASVGIDNQGGRDLLAVVSGPVAGSDLLARLTAYRSKGPRYVANLATGNRSPGSQTTGARLRLLFNPSTSVRLNLIADFVSAHGPSVDAKNHGSPTDPAGAFFSTTTAHVAGGAQPLIVQDPYADYYSFDSRLHRWSGSTIARLDYDTPFATVTSISTFRESRVRERRDLDASSLDAVAQAVGERSRQFTQELRIASGREDEPPVGRLRWIAGVFLYHDATERTDSFEFGRDSLSALRTGTPQTDTFLGHYRSWSWAAFGEATFDPLARLSLTFGGRYTEDLRRLVQSDHASRPAAGFIASNFTSPLIRRDDHALTPKLSLSYELSHSTRAYFTASGGYKGGGFQYIPTTSAAAQSTFGPERSHASEIGAKTRFWSGRGSISLAAYQYDVKGLQVQRSTTLLDGTIAIVTNNAAESTIRGAEVNAILEPSDGLLLNVGYSFLEAKFDRYLTVSPGGVATPASDYSGTPIPRSPTHSASLSASYKARVGPSQVLTPSLELSYRSHFFFEPGGGQVRYSAALPMTRQSGYALANVGLSCRMGKLELRAFVDNLFNRLYLTDVQKLPLDYIINYPAQPRRYGLTVRVDL